MSVSYPAIKCEQNNKCFYVSVLPSSVLKKTCFVSRKKEDPEKGFQRLLSEARAKNIAQYLDVQKEVIPSALILSAQKESKFVFDSENNKIRFNEVVDSMLVIDGQHRLFGLMESEHEYDIPVVVFTNLDLKSEVKLFIDINTTQKGVPSALLLDIKEMAERDTPVEKRQRVLFDKLDNDSVLSGYLLRNESKAGKISRKVFNTATNSIYESVFFQGYSDEVIYLTVKNYLEAIQYSFKLSNNTNARIGKSIFFRSAMNIFIEVCEKVLDKNKNLKVESFKEYVEPLSEMNFNEYTGSNNASIAKATSEMKKLLQSKIRIDEDMF